MNLDFPQKAVLWAANGLDNAGEVKVDAAVEVNVRWEESRIQASDGRTSSVGTEIEVWVESEIAINSIMWVGSLSSLPDTLSNLKQVISYQEIPDIKGRDFERVVMLMKYGDSLPTLA